MGPTSERIALISDVHGNLTALDAVLADIDARGISRIFNLGDYVGKGHRGREVVEICRERCEVNILGNWDDFLPHPAREFDNARGQLRAVAYRMLGSLTEADDAVQEAWLRLARSEAERIENLRAWLTTVVGRICLDMLRTRAARREDALDDVHLPDLVLSRADDPEPAAELADAVGLALIVVLDTLNPAERLAFVLHDMFGVPFDDVAVIVGKTPAAAKMLASRARRRVRGVQPERPDVARQRQVVDALVAASREGSFEGLVAVLDPDIVLRVDYGDVRSRIVRGAENVASQALQFSQFAPYARRLTVNGLAGMAAVVDGQPMSVLSFDVRDGRIVGIDILADLESDQPPQPRTLFWRQRRGERTWRAAREGDLKRIWRHDGDSVEQWLFDLSTDPGEKQDLLSERSAEAARLQSLAGAGPLFARVAISAAEAPRVLPERDGVVLKNRFRAAMGLKA